MLNAYKTDSVFHKRKNALTQAIGKIKSCNLTNEEVDQVERFKRATMTAECDDDEARVNARLSKIAKAKPPAEPDKK